MQFEVCLQPSDPCREEKNKSLRCSLRPAISQVNKCLGGGTKQGAAGCLNPRQNDLHDHQSLRLFPASSSHHPALVEAMQLPKYYFWIYFRPFQHQTTHSVNEIAARISLWT